MELGTAKVEGLTAAVWAAGRALLVADPVAAEELAGRRLVDADVPLGLAGQLIALEAELAGLSPATPAANACAAGDGEHRALAWGQARTVVRDELVRPGETERAAATAALAAWEAFTRRCRDARSELLADGVLTAGAIGIEALVAAVGAAEPGGDGARRVLALLSEEAPADPRADLERVAAGLRAGLHGTAVDAAGAALHSEALRLFDAALDATGYDAFYGRLFDCGPPLVAAAALGASGDPGDLLRRVQESLLRGFANLSLTEFDVDRRLVAETRSEHGDEAARALATELVELHAFWPRALRPALLGEQPL